MKKELLNLIRKKEINVLTYNRISSYFKERILAEEVRII